MKNERKLAAGQIFSLIATGVFGLFAMLFGIACIRFEHLMEGAAIVLFDIVLVTLRVVMICDNNPKVKVPDLGAKVFTMRGIKATCDGKFDGEANVTCLTDGIRIDGIGKSPIWYKFDEMSMCSFDRPGELAFVVNMDQTVVLSGIKPLHVKALAEACKKHGVKGVLADGD